MALVTDLRNGLAANLATISGLRQQAWQPDNINPPAAFIFPQGVSFDNAYGRGMNTYTFVVTVVVGRQSERSSQNALDTYVSGTGANSVKRAIESDKTLGGKAFDVRVTDVRNYGELTAGEVTYLSAEFVVLCYAD